MAYFAFIQNDLINGCGQARCLNEDIISAEITEEVYNNLDHYIWNGTSVVLNPNYDEEQAQKREAEFKKQFFNTSLGYIRRSVTMADGSHKDFLSDLLPTISMALNMNTPVTILAYDEPPFDHDIEDWTPYQHTALVTAQFVQECFIQLQNDFIPQGE